MIVMSSGTLTATLLGIGFLPHIDASNLSSSPTGSRSLRGASVSSAASSSVAVSATSAEYESVTIDDMSFDANAQRLLYGGLTQEEESELSARLYEQFVGEILSSAAAAGGEDGWVDEDVNGAEIYVADDAGVSSDPTAKDLQVEDLRRRLMAGHAMEFVTLTCNAHIESADCEVTTLESIVAASVGGEVVVPCGTCAYVSTSDGTTLNMPNGLNVVGKLYVPPTSSLTLKTTHVFVQGELEIEAPQEGNIVRFLLHGTEDRYIFPPDGEMNAMACDAETGCKVGKKPIAVAGGKLNIRGLTDPTCPSWVKLQDLQDTPFIPSEACSGLVPYNGDAEDAGAAIPFLPTNLYYKLLTSSDNHCSEPLMAVSRDECLAAVQSTMPEGHVQDRNYLVEGSWGHVAPGCSAQGISWDAHWNDNSNGVNNGDFPPMCKDPEYSGPLPIIVTDEVDGNKYFAVRGRTAHWDGISLQLSTEGLGCLGLGTEQWEASFRYRFHTSEEAGGIVQLRVDYKRVSDGGWEYNAVSAQCDNAASLATGWVNCEMNFDVNFDSNIASEIQFNFFSTGELSDLGFDDVIIVPSAKKDTRVVVGSHAASCWNVGDEVLLTSPDMHHTFRHTFVVAAVNANDGILTAVDSVPEYFQHATMAADTDFAVEVASLRRSIIFEAEDDDSAADGLHGGHLIVYHTPLIEQMVQGVELVNFGQQGNLGRYPLHFHMSGDCAGSVLSKNVVRNSNQRCIVVHGTDNVLIEDNVAYETAGHCFFTEDGAETGNTFERNLGASIHAPTHIIPGENDSSPSVFWITNPGNNWIDNVAAGSDNSGYWFDTQKLPRGPSLALLQEANIPIASPRSSPLGTFQGNTAHSSNRFGIQYYPPGYRPSSRQYIVDSRSYRNRWAGHFVHANQLLSITGGLVADNGASYQTFRNTEIDVEDTTIIGTSGNYQSILAMTKSWWFCTPSHQGGVNGLIIHPYKLGGAYDIRAKNIEFSGFGPASGCNEDTTAIYLSVDQAFKKHYGSAHRFSGLTFADEEPYNRMRFCPAISDGVYGISIEDMDGSLSPTGNPGFFISDDPTIVPFAGVGDGCNTVEGSCLLFCEGVCLRTFSVDTNNAQSTRDIEMVVSDGNAVAIDSWHYYANIAEDLTRADLNGYFGTTIGASGTYTINFRDKVTLQPAWPDYVRYALEDAPACADHGTDPEINVIVPTPDPDRCNDLIKHGNFESGTFDGWQQGTADRHWVNMTLVSPGAGGSEKMLKVIGRTAAVDFVSQYVDVSCLEVGQWYGFTAAMRVEDMDENPIICNSSSDCPRARLIFETWSSHTTEVLLASASSATIVDGFYQMEGYIGMTEDMANADAVYLKFDQPADATYLIDDVSLFQVSSPTASPTEYLNIPYKVLWDADRLCPEPLWMPVPKDDCLGVVQSLMPEGHVQGRTYLVQGSWGDLPPGCSAQLGSSESWDAHWNDNTNGVNSWGNYRVICENSEYIDLSPTVTPTVRPNVEYKALAKTDNECPQPFWMSVSRAECLVAVKSAMPEGHVQDRPWLTAGSWGGLPPGCTAQWGSWDAHWNDDTNGVNSWGNYSPVCKNPDYVDLSPTVTPTVLPNVEYKALAKTDNGCPQPLWMPVSKADCLGAVQSAMPEGHIQGRTWLSAGSWSDLPPGCSAQSGTWDAHWNDDTNGVNSWSNYSPVCKNPDYVDLSPRPNVEYMALAKTDNGCAQPLWTPVSKDDCLGAVQSAMPEGHVQGRTWLSAWSWSDLPPGCSAQWGTWDAHWNDNTNGVNIWGNYSPVCKNPDYVDLSPTATPTVRPNIEYKRLTRADNECPQPFWMNVSRAECLAAVQSAMPEGHVQERTYLSAGSWGFVAPGCSAQWGTWDAHWNDNTDGQNNGDFPPVCKNPNFTP